MSIGNAADSFSDRTSQRWHQVSDWISANSLDLGVALIAAILVAIVLIGLRQFGHRLIKDRDQAISWRTIFGRVLARTSFVFIAAAAVKLVSEQALTPPPLQRTIDIVFIVAAAFQAAVWGRELILGFIQHRVGETEANSTIGSAIGIIRLLVTVTLFAIAIILILSNLGVNVTGLVAGLGIGGIAIGLAAQGIFSDLFAALSIIFDKPFRKGDTITFGNPLTTGIVEHIGLKSTRIRSLNGEEVVISNTKLLEQQVQNWALLRRRRAVLTFGLIYQTPHDVLAQLPHEMRAIVERQPLAVFERAHAVAFGPSSIDFELVFQVESADMPEFMQVRQDVMLDLIRRFQELGADFAYPTQMGFLGGLDGKPVDPRDIPPHLAPAP